jgi:hypothetical protein
MKSRAFSEYPHQLQAAVNAYDETRREVHSEGKHPLGPPMSEANKATIAPMIMAAIRAYVEAGR